MGVKIELCSFVTFFHRYAPNPLDLPIMSAARAILWLAKCCSVFFLPSLLMPDTCIKVNVCYIICY